MPHAAYATQWRQPSWRRILERLWLAGEHGASRPSAKVVDLEAGHCHALRDAVGASVQCEAGQVWITQHDDPVDITLQAGERFRIDRPGKTLALAIGPCRLRIER